MTFHSVMRTCEFISATRTIVIFAPFFLALATVLQIHIVVNRIYFIHLFKKKMVRTQRVWDLLFIYKMLIFFFFLLIELYKVVCCCLVDRVINVCVLFLFLL